MILRSLDTAVQEARYSIHPANAEVMTATLERLAEMRRPDPPPPRIRSNRFTMAEWDDAPGSVVGAPTDELGHGPSLPVRADEAPNGEEAPEHGGLDTP